MGRVSRFRVDSKTPQKIGKVLYGRGRLASAEEELNVTS